MPAWGSLRGPLHALQRSLGGFAFRLTFLNRCDEDERAIVAEYYQRSIGDELVVETRPAPGRR